MVDFDESKHPRDHGKFAPTGGSASPPPGAFGGPPMPPYGTPEWQAAWQERWAAAGIKGGIPTVDLDDHTKAEGAARMALAAGRVGSALGFDPKNLTVTDKDYQFNLNGHQHAAAGTHLDGQVKLYVDQLGPGQIKEVMSHEVEHAKFQAFLDDYQKQYDAVMKEPGAAPDPNGKYYWQKRGGSDSVMSADGNLREPYASKYPLYTLYHNLTDGDPRMSGQSNIEQMRKEDGCSPYSRDWWKAVENGTANFRQGFHETLAEMAAARSKILPTSPEQTHDEQLRFASPPTAVYHTDLPSYEPGKYESGYLLKNEPSPHWNALFEAVEKNWQEKHAMK